MSQRLIFATLFLITFFSCGENSSSSKVEGVSIDFIKTFEGEIDNKYPIIAKIQSNSGVVSGSYLYKKGGQELELKGKIGQDGKVEISELDSKGNLTGIFKGEFSSESKIEGSWEKSNEGKEMPFYLIESSTDYNATKKGFQGNDSDGKMVKILYRQEEYDKELKANTPVLKVNTDFLTTADDGIRAIVGYYNTIAGTDCWWRNDNPNSDYTNLSCKLTEALNFGNQCSEKQKGFLRKWFSNENKILDEIEGCYNVPYTATSQSTFDYLNLEINGNNVTVKYRIMGVNLRDEANWETKGVDKFNVIGSTIRVISRKKL